MVTDVVVVVVEIEDVDVVDRDDVDVLVDGSVVVGIEDVPWTQCEGVVTQFIVVVVESEVELVVESIGWMCRRCTVTGL